MSQFNFLGDSSAKLPEPPNLNQTLLLIETIRYFPSVSQASIGENIDQKVQEQVEAEISLDHKIQPAQIETITSTSLIKKKKAGCNCKKTKCLKLYCDCFGMGKDCSYDCVCQACYNDGLHQNFVIKAREIIKHKLSSSKKQNNKGCNCKKSQCQKKYCQCFSAGVSCGSSCKCQDCENIQLEDHVQQREPSKDEEEGIINEFNWSDLL